MNKRHGFLIPFDKLYVCTKNILSVIYIFFLPVFVTTKIDIYCSIYKMNMKPQSHFCLLLLKCYLVFTWLKKVFRTRKNKIETIALNFVFEVIITHLGNQAFRFGVMYLSNNWNCLIFGTTSPHLGHKIFFLHRMKTK